MQAQSYHELIISDSRKTSRSRLKITQRKLWTARYTHLSFVKILRNFHQLNALRYCLLRRIPSGFSKTLIFDIIELMQRGDKTT